jgi:site-specific recombinase XerD
VRQADSLLRGRGTSLEAATRADLEAFMGDLLARRMPSTAATYHKVLKILYGWLAEEEVIPTNPILSADSSPARMNILLPPGGPEPPASGFARRRPRLGLVNPGGSARLTDG